MDLIGTAHLVWNGGESNIFHAEISLGKLMGIETVATGVFPSLAIDGENLIVTYNSDVTFPDQSGGVFISEKLKMGNGQPGKKFHGRVSGQVHRLLEY